jgi:hypothetical protein
MAKRISTAVGELYENNGRDYVGCIHRAEGGYVVRIPDGSSIGPVAFNGQVFSGKAFRLIRNFRVSASRSIHQYEIATVTT